MLNHWHSYGFCLLSNGQCPPGFTKQQNWMKALKIFTVKPVGGQSRLHGIFGDSIMTRHWYQDDAHADLILSTCCKTFDKQSQLSKVVRDFKKILLKINLWLILFLNQIKSAVSEQFTSFEETRKKSNRASS